MYLVVNVKFIGVTKGHRWITVLHFILCWFLLLQDSIFIDTKTRLYSLILFIFPTMLWLFGKELDL